jgi:hypothetical protein
VDGIHCNFLNITGKNKKKKEYNFEELKHFPVVMLYYVCWYSFRYGNVSPGDSLPHSTVLPRSLRSLQNNKRLVGGADYAHSDA